MITDRILNLSKRGVLLLAGQRLSNQQKCDAVQSILESAVYEGTLVNNDKQICTFTFSNGTQINVAVPFLGDKAELISYDEMFAKAKKLIDFPNQSNGRGSLVGFEIGKVIWA